MNLAYLMRFQDAVNADWWKGVPPRCAKIVEVEAGDKQYENSVPFQELTVSVALNYETWDKILLDHGTHRLANLAGIAGAAFG